MTMEELLKSIDAKPIKSLDGFDKINASYRNDAATSIYHKIGYKRMTERERLIRYDQLLKKAKWEELGDENYAFEVLRQEMLNLEPHERRYVFYAYKKNINNIIDELFWHFRKQKERIVAASHIEALCLRDLNIHQLLNTLKKDRGRIIFKNFEAVMQRLRKEFSDDSAMAE
jgi:hypothetical protein